jgi:hypothetical protein
MAKRFTDTEKYKKGWFRTLPPKMKCMWDYLTMTCDIAGVWDEDYDAASFHVGESIAREETLTTFGDRLRRVSSDKLLIVDFIPFQYGPLTPGEKGSKLHKAIIRILTEHSVPVEPYALPMPLEGHSKGMAMPPKEAPMVAPMVAPKEPPRQGQGQGQGQGYGQGKGQGQGQGQGQGRALGLTLMTWEQKVTADKRWLDSLPSVTPEEAGF